MMLTLPAWGDDTPKADDFGADCGNGGATEIISCLVDAYKAADVKLNQVYKSLKERLSATERAALLHDERAWIKARDQECTVDPSPEEDDEAPGAHLFASEQMNECELQSTKARIKVLEDRLKTLPAVKTTSP